MNKFIALLMVLTGSAYADDLGMRITLGQSVQIEQGWKLDLEPTVADSTYATVIGAKRLAPDLIELEFEIFLTGPDRRGLLQLNPKTALTFKAYVSPARTLDDVPGLRVIHEKYWFSRR